MNHIKLILASASPRRRELLSALEIPFVVVVPAIDERAWPEESPASFALRMAHEKALTIAAGQPNENPLCIVAADTIVVLHGKILGKPADAEDASRMLHALSGQHHTVITGICVMKRDGSQFTIQGEAVRTQVTFRHVSEPEIHHYIATGEPMDKAGAYAIQGGAAGMVDHIDGSYSNVVGLPMETLARLLEHRT